jgi:hypothetical protein
MNISSSLKATAVTIGLLAVSAAGISAVPNQNSSGLHTGISSRTEGDSNPWPMPTLTRYMPGPTATVTERPKRKPAPTVTRYVPGPTHTAYVPGPTRTRTVRTPGPTVTVTASPSK